MAIETPREKLIYQGLVPIVGAILGAIAATWYQASSVDSSQLEQIVKLVNAPGLTADQKLQALDLYKEITDRPWSVIRSLVSYLGLTVGFLAGAGILGQMLVPKHTDQRES